MAFIFPDSLRTNLHHPPPPNQMYTLQYFSSCIEKSYTNTYEYMFIIHLEEFCHWFKKRVVFIHLYFAFFAQENIVDFYSSPLAWFNLSTLMAKRYRMHILVSPLFQFPYWWAFILILVFYCSRNNFIINTYVHPSFIYWGFTSKRRFPKVA